jgi:hypothetical protein
MPKALGLLSKVTFVAHRIGVYGDLRMIGITRLPGGRRLSLPGRREGETRPGRSGFVHQPEKPSKTVR